MLPLRLIEEIRLLTNIVREGNRGCGWCWPAAWRWRSGWQVLSWSRSISGSQRGAICSRWGATRRFITSRSRFAAAARGRDGLLTADAQTSVHTASDGIPRLINQICDHALMLAALGGQPQIDAARHRRGVGRPAAVAAAAARAAGAGGGGRRNGQAGRTLSSSASWATSRRWREAIGPRHGGHGDGQASTRSAARSIR